MKFLVWARREIPAGVSVGEREALTKSDLRVCVKQLRQRRILQIWSGPLAAESMSIWSAPDVGEVHAGLRAWPSHRWLSVTVTPLSPHPASSEEPDLQLRTAAATLDTAPQHCVLYELVPGAGESYDQYHLEAWPKVIEHLRAVGILDYSIFRRGDLVISIYRQGRGNSGGGKDSELLNRWTTLMGEHFANIVDADGRPLSAQRVFRLV